MKIIFTLFLCTFSLYLSLGQCAGGDPSTDGPNWNFALSIEDNLNAARRFEEIDRSLTTNCLGNMSPIPGGWAAATDDEIALYIHNAEREARGVLALECVESHLDMVAQAHSDWQIANGVFSHGGDAALGSTSSYSLCGACSSISGSSPFERMNQSAPLMGQWETESENIAIFVTSGVTISDAVARSMYLFIYQDQGSAWGHRHNVLLNFTNNFGSTDDEGFIGVGVHQGGPYVACPFSCTSWNTASIVTVDYYDPQGTASGFSCSTILPIQLLTFKAASNVGSIDLTWSAISTHSQDYFIIEKSLGKGIFDPIGELFTNVDPGKLGNYKFEDDYPSVITAYYRLKMMNFDGTFSYSKILSVEPEDQHQISVYPNPVKDILYIKGLQGEKSSALNIYSREGQLLYTSNLTSNTLNLSFLNKGLYFYQIVSNDKILNANKFIKL